MSRVISDINLEFYLVLSLNKNNIMTKDLLFIMADFAEQYNFQLYKMQLRILRALKEYFANLAKVLKQSC